MNKGKNEERKHRKKGKREKRKKMRNCLWLKHRMHGGEAGSVSLQQY